MEFLIGVAVVAFLLVYLNHRFQKTNIPYEDRKDAEKISSESAKSELL